MPIPFSTVLVTGASGFVGRHLEPALAARLPEGGRLILAPPPQPEPGDGLPPFDLERPETVARLVREVRPDLIVHLAAQASVGASSAAARQTWAVNFGGSFALADAIAEFAPNCALFFVSSAEVYGRAFNAGPATEDTPLQPMSVYARSKAAAEAMLADVLPATSRLIVVRPSNHSGAGQGPGFVLPAFAEQLARVERQGGGEIRVGNLDAARDFMDVRDVVDAYCALLEHAGALPSRATFNVASGRVVTIGGLLERLRALSHAPASVVVDPDRQRPSEIARAEVDAARLRAFTGWSPRRAIDETILEVLSEHRGAVA